MGRYTLAVGAVLFFLAAIIIGNSPLTWDDGTDCGTPWEPRGPTGLDTHHCSTSIATWSTLSAACIALTVIATVAAAGTRPPTKGTE